MSNGLLAVAGRAPRAARIARERLAAVGRGLGGLVFGLTVLAAAFGAGVAPSAAAAPDAPVLSATPPVLSGSNSATFQFSLAGGVAECSLDGGAWAGCSSPQTYVALADGAHTFLVRANDAGETSLPAAYSWTVDTVSPPSPSVLAPADGSTVSVNQRGVTGYAEPNTTVTVYIDGSAVGSATVDAAGQWSYTLTAALTLGSHTVKARASDAAGNASPDSATRTFTVVSELTATQAITGITAVRNVSNINVRPVSGSGGQAPLVYAIGGATLPTGLSYDSSTGTLSGMPTSVLPATDFTITITDAVGQSVSRNLRLTILSEKSQNIIFTSTPPASALAGGPTYTPTAIASSSLPVTLTIDSSSGAVCALSGGVVSFIGVGTCVINADQAGDANWDPAPQVRQSFTVTANPPVAADRSLSVPYDSGAAIDLSGAVTGLYGAISVVSAPAHGSTSVSGTTITYTPAAGYFGADSFTYAATGPGGTSTPATVSVTVATPPAPIAADRAGLAVPYDSGGVAIDLSGAITGVYTAISVATAPAHGTTSVSGATITYTPAAGYFGADSFTYAATGPGGTSTPATVSLTVATPSAPVVTPPAPVVVSASVQFDLAAVTTGVTDGYAVSANAQHGAASISGDGSAGRPWTLTYVPASGFLGTDTVSVIASGPGGTSAPAVFVFQVPGTAPTLSVQVLSNASVTISPTAGLVGGPFTAVRVTRAPAFGTATVSGLDIVFTPGGANQGATSMDYVIDLPFGESAPGRIDLTANPAPGAQALTARTVEGAPVTVRISDTTGGPFTGAAVVSVGPTGAGAATVTGGGGVYDLTFTPAAGFSGSAVATFSLTNAFGTTDGVVTITVDSRPDPAQNPEVVGLASSQIGSARRFADAQIGNFHSRLRALHDGMNDSSHGLSLNVGVGGQADLDNDPREALRRQLGRGDRVDPGALGDDRSRDRLGLDLWAGREGPDESRDAGRDRLGVRSDAAGVRDAGPGFWTAGAVDWGRQDARGQRDYRFTTQGVTAGMDMRLSDRLIVGGGLGYGEDKTKVGDQGSVSKARGVTGALYASWRPADAFYVDGVLGWSDLDFSSRRWTTGLAGDPDAFAEGDRSGDARFLSAAFGRVIRSGPSVREVYARLDARSITLDAFTETAAGLSSLTWDEVEQDSVSANLGAIWRSRIRHDSLGLMRPAARIEWSHEFEDLGDQGVRYADWAASPTYLVRLDSWSRNTVRVELGTDWVLGDRLMLGVGYRGAYGDAGVSHGGEARISIDW